MRLLLTWIRKLEGGWKKLIARSPPSEATGCQSYDPKEAGGRESPPYGNFTGQPAPSGGNPRPAAL